MSPDPTTTHFFSPTPAHVMSIWDPEWGKARGWEKGGNRNVGGL